MREIIELFKKSSPILIILVIIAYFLKFSVEKKIEGVIGRVEEIAKTSLEIKKEIRGEERAQLVNLRVAIEKWEDFLLTGLFDYTMMPSPDAKVSALYKEDKKLFLDVKIAIVKTCIYLRDEELEKQLIGMVLNIRKSYYPLIFESLPTLIDIQTKLAPIEYKLNKFRESNFQDMTYAPTQKDREENLRLQTMMTEETKKFSEKYLQLQPDIAEQMKKLKEVINDYIYRPIHKAAIDKE